MVKPDESPLAPSTAMSAWRQVGGWWPFVLLVPVYALFNALVGPYLIDRWLERMGTPGDVPWLIHAVSFVGFTVIGETAFFSVWAAVGPGHWMWRNAATLLAAFCIWASFVAGLAFAFRDNIGVSGDIDWTLFFVLPLAFLLTQAPGWFLKIVLGYQSVFRGVIVASDKDARRFSIANLLALTAAIASALAIAQLRLTPADRDASARAQVATTVIEVCLWSLVFGLLVVLPSIWAALVARRGVVGFTIIVAYAAAAAAAPALIQSLHTGDAKTFGPRFTAAAAPCAALLMSLYGSLLVARACGYTLRRAKRRL